VINSLSGSHADQKIVVRFTCLLILDSCRVSAGGTCLSGQVPTAAAAGKKKSKKHAADKKYGGLESARQAPGRRVSSTRYTTEPRKDDPKSLYAPMNAASSARGAADAGKDVDELQMPVVAENDYLLPQSGATAPPYIDVVPDNSRGIQSSLLSSIYCCFYYTVFGKTGPTVFCG